MMGGKVERNGVSLGGIPQSSVRGRFVRKLSRFGWAGTVTDWTDSGTVAGRNDDYYPVGDGLGGSDELDRLE